MKKYKVVFSVHGDKMEAVITACDENAAIKAILDQYHCGGVVIMECTLIS